MSNIIDIVIRSKDETEAGVSSAGKSASALQGIFQGIGQAAGNMLADLPGQALGFFKGAIDSASDLGETISKNQTVFGAAANDLLAWADNAPKALGLTKQAALDATGSLGNMFTQLGIGADKAREMSQSSVQLASDFASFQNADPTEVLEAISAAYRGEYDALQKYVPTINAAKVETEALAMSHKTSKDALTDQDKALAVNSLMLKGAGAAAGDFARTSSGAANQGRVAGAMFEDLKVKIGNALLPVWTQLLGFITGQFLPALDGLATTLSTSLGPALETVKSMGQTAFEWVKDKPEVLAAIGAVIGTVLVAAFIALAGAAWSAAAGVIAATWPLLAIGVAIAALVGGLLWAYNHWTLFHDAVDSVVAFLVTNVPPAFALVQSVIAVVVDWVTNVAVPFLVGAFNSFVGFLQGTLWPAVQTVWSGIQIAIGWAVNAILPVISFMVDFIRDNFGHITEILNIFADWFKNQIANMWQIVSNLFQFFLNIISGNWSGAWENIKNVASAIWDSIKNTVASGVGVLRELVQGLASFIGSLGGRMWEGIRTGFVNVINWVIDRWNGLSFSTPNIPGTNFGGATFSVPKLGRLAHGGIWSGLALVGERGPELVNLPAGSKVTPNNQTSAMLSAPAPVVNVNLYVGGSIRSDRDIVRLMRDELTNLGLQGAAITAVGAGL